MLMMDMDVRNQRNVSLTVSQGSRPKIRGRKQGRTFQCNQRECVRSVIEPNSREYCNNQRECVRSVVEPNSCYCNNQRERLRSVIVPNDREFCKNYDSRLLQQEDNTDYPRTFRPNQSSICVSSEDARPRKNYWEGYVAEDVPPYQSFSQPNFTQRRFSDGPSFSNYHAVDVVLDQPFSQPSLLQSTRQLDGPSHSIYHAAKDVDLDQPFPPARLPLSIVHSGSAPYSNYHAAEDDVLDLPFSQSSLPQRRKHVGSRHSPSYVNHDAAEDVVLDNPFSRSSFPQSRRRSASPSYSSFQRETKYKSSYRERNPRNCERKHQYHANRRQDFRSIRDLSPKHNHGGQRSSLPMKGRFSSKRGFKKPTANYAKVNSQVRKPVGQTNVNRLDEPSYARKGIRELSPNYNRDGRESYPSVKDKFTSKRGFKKCAKVDSQSKIPDRQTNASKSDEPHYAPKVDTPASKNVNSANKMKTECLEGNGQVDSSADAADLAEKLSKDNAKISLTKEPTDQMIPAKEGHKGVVGCEEKKLNNEADAVPHGSSPYHKAKHPSNVKHQYHAECSQDRRSIRDLSPKHNRSGLESSPARKGRFTLKRGFRKPIESSAKYTAQDKKPDSQANVNKSDESSYTPTVAVDTLVSKNVSSAIKMEMNCSKDDREVDPSAAELATRLPKDTAEISLETKVDPSVAELATGLPKDTADVSLTKEPTTPGKEDNKDRAECERQKQNNEADAVLHGSLPYDEDSRMKDFSVNCLAKRDSRKRDLDANVSSQEDASSCYVKLFKDKKIICRTKCSNPPFKPSSSWNIDIIKRNSIEGLFDLPQFSLFPAFENSRQKLEWIRFLTYLCSYNKVATVVFDNLKIHVYPPPKYTKPSNTDDGLYFTHAVVAYELQELCDTSVDQRHAISGASKPVVKNEGKESSQLPPIPQTPCNNNIPAFGSVTYIRRSSSAEKGTCSSIAKCHEAVDSPNHFSAKDDIAAEQNFVRTDPSYLKTLGQAHSSWIFGAIAELIDNSRDARASRLDIAVETIYDKTMDCAIPMLSIIDDGVGMNHQEILRMISFGHKQPDEDNLDCIGRFGVGFKTGSMKLGRDALVLTQTPNSRSVAFLSQSLNEGKDNLEIPVVSYRRQAQCMEIDTNVQSEVLAKYNLSTMKEFSPFDEYLIGEKVGLFQGNCGTQIYIWNLDKWGSTYTLEWQEGMLGGSSFHQGDIYIRSRRVRTRPGQTSRKVHLDYSLRSYLKVIFLDPRMKIYVQGSLVKSRPLAKSLNKTTVINGEIVGKQVQLTLGRSQVEWDEANCGIFLYWHGRLIEAYKRVGGMIHSADMGRGVIGVIDVTELMHDGNGGVLVHNNKQGFQDCEPYAFLEEWLGRMADEYWDKIFDPVQLEKHNAQYKPDNEWVQCNKCRKWRRLSNGFDSSNLPDEWFCYMQPFGGRCEMPEEKAGRGVITVGLKRSSDDRSIAADCSGGFLVDNDTPVVEGNSRKESTKMATDNAEEHPQFKRLRRGPRTTRKKLKR